MISAIERSQICPGWVTSHPATRGNRRTRAFNFVVVSFWVSAELQDRSAHSILAFFIAWATAIGCSLPAIGETLAPSYVQGQQTQQSSPEQQDPDYNGEDFTRPQRSFDTRFTYISSGTTSQTDRETWLLRGNWKTELDGGWRLALLAQAPIVNKTTLNSNGSAQDFGIGDTAFQAALIHDIDRHWAFGFGARLVAPTAETRWEAVSGRSCPGSECAIPSLKSGPTPISCLLFDTRSALPVILRDGISVNRRLHQH